MNNDIRELAAQDALDAFWAAVAKKFPEITSGDCDPGFILQMEAQAADWIDYWYNINTNEEATK